MGGRRRYAGQMSERPPFGIAVHVPHPTNPDDEFDDGECWEKPYDVAHGEYGIWLPHSCDYWQIADGSDKAAVLAEARRFRDELDAAIAKLEAAG